MRKCGAVQHLYHTSPCIGNVLLKILSFSHHHHWVKYGWTGSLGRVHRAIIVTTPFSNQFISPFPFKFHSHLIQGYCIARNMEKHISPSVPYSIFWSGSVFLMCVKGKVYVKDGEWSLARRLFVFLFYMLLLADFHCLIYGQESIGIATQNLENIFLAKNSL